MKGCKCKDWKENVGLINSAILLYNNHGFGSLKKAFNYCPYCGHNLEELKKQQDDLK